MADMAVRSSEGTCPDSYSLSVSPHAPGIKTDVDAHIHLEPTTVGLHWVCSERLRGARCDFLTTDASKLTDHLRTSHGEHTGDGSPRLRRVTLESSHMQCLDCGWSSMGDHDWRQHVCPIKIRKLSPVETCTEPELKPVSVTAEPPLPLLTSADVMKLIPNRGLTKDQLSSLVFEFSEDLYPDRSKKLGVCDRIGIPERKLNNWLARRRVLTWKKKVTNLPNEKKEQLLKDLCSCHPGLHDYDSLARVHNLQAGLIKFFYHSNKSSVMLARQGQLTVNFDCNSVKLEPTDYLTPTNSQSTVPIGNAQLMELLSKLM